MKYVYPAIITPEDGKYLVEVPDLPGTFTFGVDVPDALFMANDAIEMWLYDAENKHEAIPNPTPLNELPCPENAFATLVAADTDSYRRKVDTRAVKKTLSIPGWLNYAAEKTDAPLSAILQKGLKEYLHIAD